ncbi:MAG: ATP-dependent DNA helicase RecG [Verrucomicrobia bacterium]|nr:ATP-dependent DNA helicase RecG [Verrucomicrobiota bacterium]
MSEAASTPKPSALARPVVVLRGVGPDRRAQLARLGLNTVGDLLFHRPRRYEDRRHFRRIGEVQLGELAATRGHIVALGLKRYAKGQKSVFEFILEDGTGRLHCRWWNLPYMQQYFAQGDEVLVYGKVNSLRPRTIDHPETEVVVANEDNSIHLSRIVPIYPLTEGLSQRWLRSLIFRAFQEYGTAITEPWPKLSIPDLPPRRKAVEMLHYPAELVDLELSRCRLALDELIDLQLAIQRRRKRLAANARGWPCGGDNRLIKPFLAQLGFSLTTAQTKVLREIRKDMSGGQPMRRLLQGDVGSGKTVVAACCTLMALESGFNVVLMAPTEILAEQHFQNFARWFGRLGIEVGLRTGSYRTSNAEQRTSSIEPRTSNVEPPARSPSPLASRLSPKADRQSPIANRQSPALTIGTHALIEDSFGQENLGLVIIDEQHKFGVAQREKLVRKGRYPHLLVMTATPIPRTLGLTLYGDLDISVIDELPPGRSPVKTFVRSAERLPKVWEFIRDKLTEGRQAFVVYSRVEEGGTGGLKAVTKERDAVQKALASYRVGLLHGRLPSEEKEKTMAAFRNGAIHVLLATSLVEVGVDVPNATIMLVENAEQFGLAQLHQLRGRIGRGSHESYCILVAAPNSPEAEERLKVLEETGDGFRIAEADLKLRGPGDLLGQEQSGMPPLAFADLKEDLALIERARSLAASIITVEPGNRHSTADERR